MISPNRVVDLRGELTKEAGEDISSKLYQLDKESKEPIVLAINSKGGRGIAIVTILRAIKEIKSSVYGVVVGIAHSAAFVILQSCEQRIACTHPNVSLLFHPSKIHVEDLKRLSGLGNELDVEGPLALVVDDTLVEGEIKGGYFRAVADDDMYEEFLIELANRSGQTVAKLKQYTDQRLSPHKALELGLLDDLDRYLKVIKIK